MKRKSLNFAVGYLILVALPVLVFVGVLRSGRTLVAPVSVGGLWRIQANGENVVVLPCGEPLVVADSNFTILQSGKNFTLNFDRSVMSSTSGTVEGTIIRATILPAAKWAKGTRCDLARVLTLTATVDSRVNAHFLAGVLSVGDCPACALVHFRAVREEQAKASGVN